MKRLFLALLLLGGCALHSPAGVSMVRLNWMGFKNPPPEWRPAGRFAPCRVIDGAYIAVDAQRDDWVARLDCPQERPSHRAVVLSIKTQRLVAHGRYWVE